MISLKLIKYTTNAIYNLLFSYFRFFFSLSLYLLCEAFRFFFARMHHVCLLPFVLYRSALERAVNVVVVATVELLAYFQNVCWLRGYLIILKLFAGIEIVAKPVTFDMVANDAAVTFGCTFEITFVGIVLPTTVNFWNEKQLSKIFVCLFKR